MTELVPYLALAAIGAVTAVIGYVVAGGRRPRGAHRA
ncbi:hypothetical protein BH09ACT3_BH09ACT3_13690 [soil metagenome]